MLFGTEMRCFDWISRGINPHLKGTPSKLGGKQKRPLHKQEGGLYRPYGW
jgi:hypothetical protein